METNLVEQDIEKLCGDCCDDNTVQVNNEYIGKVFQWLINNDFVIYKKIGELSEKETNDTPMLNFIKDNHKTEIDINTCINSGKHKSELDYIDGEWICLNCGNIC